MSSKEQRVRDVVSPFSPRAFLPIVASPDVFFYRNKMEFVFGGLKDTPPLLGLRRKGAFDRVVDLSECRLLSPEAGPLLSAIRRWAEKERVPTYHLKSHRGFLRYVVVREGKNTGQRMVCLVTAEGTLDMESLGAAVRASGVSVDTLIWIINAGLSDVAWGEVRHVVWGQGWIEDRLGKVTFRISPRTFFQTNTRGAEGLYRGIQSLVSEGRGTGGTLFDFYCGAGSIGLFCADDVERLVGVEINPQAVEDARSNARSMGVDRAEFHAMDAAAFARNETLMSEWSSPGSVAVMDPPRPGLQTEVRRLLLTRPVDRWVYVSCNPEALARDLAILAPAYRIESVQPFDLFPHTPHVETVVLLARNSQR